MTCVCIKTAQSASATVDGGAQERTVFLAQTPWQPQGTPAHVCGGGRFLCVCGGDGWGVAPFPPPTPAHTHFHIQQHKVTGNPSMCCQLRVMIRRSACTWRLTTVAYTARVKAAAVRPSRRRRHEGSACGGLAAAAVAAMQPACSPPNKMLVAGSSNAPRRLTAHAASLLPLVLVLAMLLVSVACVGGPAALTCMALVRAHGRTGPAACQRVLLAPGTYPCLGNACPWPRPHAMTCVWRRRFGHTDLGTWCQQWSG